MEKIEAIVFDWIGTLCQFDHKGLFPYTEKVLRELKPKYKLAVISKAVSDDVPTRVRQIDEINDYFAFTAVGDDKTNNQFVSCMNLLNVKPENTLVVDDRMDRGIQIGNALGCKTAWIRQGKYAHMTPDHKTGEPTLRINSIEDLLKIL